MLTVFCGGKPSHTGGSDLEREREATWGSKNPLCPVGGALPEPSCDGSVLDGNENGWGGGDVWTDEEDGGVCGRL